ncbi:MAG: WXG100 family type VII secretion target [Nocardioides sp.]
MGTLSADHTDFRDAVADLERAADRLRADREGATRSVDGLLGSWRGRAAAAYAEGWTEWCRGADRVLDGLVTMSRLLASVDADLASTDSSSGDALARLAGRLG